MTREAWHRKVNGRGPTNRLWIKRMFGFCGELWLIFGFCAIHLGFLTDFLRFLAPEIETFSRKNVDKTWL
jgi:hypothetical protein